jgi:Calcineurin-like phosphoesterase
MYSGGIGYYGLLQQLGQPASYFCLRNTAWQILGLDTGYHDSDVFTVNTNLTFLDPNEEKWHLDKINNAGGRRTILLSHHQLFSPYGDGVGQNPTNQKGLVTNPNLLKSFSGVLGNIALWIWGHEHSCNLFQPYIGLSKGRCVGASAVPELNPNAYTQNTNLDSGAAGAFPALIQDSNNQPIQLKRDSDGAYYHCYTILRLDSIGGNSVAEYYQLDSANNGLETLLYSETI